MIAHASCVPCSSCAQLLMALKHPNIVRCIECFTAQSKLCIVMDWCSEGERRGRMPREVPVQCRRA